MVRVALLIFLSSMFFLLNSQSTGGSKNDHGLESISLEAFSQMEKKERLTLLQTITDRKWSVKDSLFYIKNFDAYLKVCEEQNDGLCKVWLLYRKLNVRSNLQLTEGQEEALYVACIKEAQKYNAQPELLVFQHYNEHFQFQKKKGKMEKCYLYLIEEFQKMQQLGMEKFKPFQISRLLYHNGQFFLNLEEYDQALVYLLEAEKHLDELTTHKNITVIILNAIQSIYQRRGEYQKGLEYAQKLMNHIQEVGHTDFQYYKLWEGLVKIDMASMKLEIGQTKESEHLAQEGYQIIGGQPSEYELGSQAELDALIVLIGIKIKLHKYEEAKPLLKRAQALRSLFTNRSASYFKQIPLFEHEIKLAEQNGDWKKVVELQKLLKPIQDSLSRKNDFKTQENLKNQNKLNQLKAELSLTLKEKQLNTWIRNASLLLLLLSGALFFSLYNTMRSKKKIKEKELENAQRELDVLSKNLIEKSNILDEMRREMIQISDEAEKNNYLEKLSSYSILKDEDWHEFKLIFEKVYPDYISSLKKEYEDITPAEIRLLVLEKLNFSQEAMANNLGISKQAIYQTKYRLRKKYGSLS